MSTIYIYVYDNKQTTYLLKKTAATVDLDIGEDRILLETRSNIYGLDVYLPFNLIQEECASQFNRRTKVCVFLENLF